MFADSAFFCLSTRLMLSLKPAHLSRYASITRLLFKYGFGDLAQDLSRHAPEIAKTSTPADGASRHEPSPEAKHPAGPEDLADDLEQLGPTFIKLGQLLSTRADFLPPEYISALERLQDDIEPIPYHIISETIEAELGVRIAKAFREFDERPLAAASIGQVHRAWLRDGRKVVVKVQRPGLHDQVRDDLDALQELATLIDAHSAMGRRVRFVQIIESLREVMLRELDYRQEAENSHTLKHNLAAFPRFVVPEVYDDFTSERVITQQFIDGAKITQISQTVLVELDRRQLADELFRVYLHQVLIDGVFHADPHPGNLSLLPDGRLALLDFGMVARVPPELRQNLMTMLLALSDGRAEEATRSAISIGTTYPKEKFQEQDFRARVLHLVGENQGRSLRKIQVGNLVMEINRAAGETGLKLPSALIMLGKTLLNLDKVVLVLDREFDPNAALQRHAGEIVQQQGMQRLSLSRVYQTVLESAHFMEQLPGRLNQIADLVANNQLKVRVDAIDERRLIAGMQKIANRITAGLILAAMIIGASLMMHLQSTLTWFGYPVIAITFFLAAAGASCVLLWRIAFVDEREAD